MRAYLDNVGAHAVAVSDLVHVAFQVRVEKLHDEVQLCVVVRNVE